MGTEKPAVCGGAQTLNTGPPTVGELRRAGFGPGRCESEGSNGRQDWREEAVADGDYRGCAVAEQTPQENNGAVLGPVEVSFVPEEHIFCKRTHPRPIGRQKRRTGSRRPLACEGPNTTTSSLGSVGNLGSPFPPSPLFGRAHARTHCIQVPRRASSRTGRGVDLDLHPPSDPIAEFPHDGFRVSAGGAHSSKHHHRRPVVYYILPSTAFTEPGNPPLHTTFISALVLASPHLTLFHYRSKPTPPPL